MINYEINNLVNYEKYDYLVCMDNANVRNTLRIIGTDNEKKIYKILKNT